MNGDFRGLIDDAVRDLCAAIGVPAHLLTGAPPMDDRAAFLRTICADPLDDTPRLVFADWLEERGEGRRAAFIRDGVALGPRPLTAFECRWAMDRGGLDAMVGVKSGERVERIRRVQGFVREWGTPGARDAFAPLPPTFYPVLAVDDDVIAEPGDMECWAVVFRGFVTGVSCPLVAWLAFGDELVAAHPVAELRLARWVSDSDLFRVSVRQWTIGDGHRVRVTLRMLGREGQCQTMFDEADLALAVDAPYVVAERLTQEFRKLARAMVAERWPTLSAVTLPAGIPRGVIPDTFAHGHVTG